MTAPRRKLVTLHLPIDGALSARIMLAVADVWPEAVVGVDGVADEAVIWSRRVDPAAERVINDLRRDADEEGS